MSIGAIPFIRMKHTDNIGYYIVALLTVIPLVLWTQTEMFPYKFTDISSSFTSLGQLAGLSGLALFAQALLLSLRLKFYERLFGAMNRVYIAHHLVGGLAFLFLMVHPLLLLMGYWQISLDLAVSFILPGTDWTVNLGRVALLSLMLLLVITYYIDLPYQLWRFTHKYLGFVCFLGGLHGLFVSSDISTEPLLRGYMVGLCGIALVGYVYRTVLGTYLIPRTRYIVDQVNVLKNNIIEIALHPQQKPIAFEPGQFMFISFICPEVSRETHPFSISSSPSPAQLGLTVKALGDYTNDLRKIKPGTTALIEGPFGAFSYLRYPAKRQIWIAGGIGVTPFLSMARTISGTSPRIDCYYAVRDESEAVFLKELTQISKKYPLFQVFPIYSTTDGRLTADIIAAKSPDFLTADVFVCGPAQMMMSLKKQLRQKGIPRDRIHTEEFAIL